jgi:hypothetical protein
MQPSPLWRTFGIVCLLAGAVHAEKQTIENQTLRVDLETSDLTVRITDKSTGAEWNLGAPHMALTDKRTIPVRLAGGIVRGAGALTYATAAGLEFRLALSGEPGALDYSFRGSLQPFGSPEMDEVELFRDSLTLGPGDGNYYALPARLGIQLRPEGDKPASRRMPALNTGRGYSMLMMGAVRDGSALLVSWDSIDTDVLVEYSGAPDRTLRTGLAMRSTARSARLQPLGRGGYVEIAKAYREVVRKRGGLETVAQKLKRNPATAKLIGAADFKPFTFYRWAPNTRYNQTDKERIDLNFTFDEVAQLAEHFKQDLGIDRAMVVAAGWITGGYDGSHPDVSPAAKEAGGNEKLAEASRRIKALGYLFGLHDNYTDFYRAAPSWNEEYIAKGSDGSLVKGGVWVGSRHT